MYKRDTSNINSTPTKTMSEKDTMFTVYENLGERSVTSSIIDVKIPAWNIIGCGYVHC